MRNLDKYYKEIEENYGKKTREAAEELYSHYDEGIYKWLAGLWDNKIGGFYYANSARDNEYVEVKGQKLLLLPDIESTEQAFGSLAGDGIVGSLSEFPEEMKRKAVEFITSCQDPEDGYFYHKQWGKNIGTSRRARDMNKGMSVVRAFGGQAKYPTAVERISEALEKNETETENSTVPEHLRSKAAFVEYLDGLEINKDSYSVGHRLGAQVPEIRAAGLADVLHEFLNSTQYDNGLWHSDLSYRASNGLMKISCAYRSLGKPLPNIEKAFGAAVEIACNEELPMSDGITCVYNPPFTMLNIFKTLEDVGDTEGLEVSRRILRERSAELLSKTAKKIVKYKEPDGSFSYCQGYPAVTSQGMHVCIPYQPESDVNANALARGSRTMTLRALGIESVPIFDENDAKLFFELAGEKY